MDLEVTLPPNSETISPIFITSPYNHSGAAMLQRALCTGQNSICYGDNLFDELLSLIDWSVGLVERHQEQKEWESSVLDLALNRTPTTWMPDLGPSPDIYSASLFSVAYNLPFTAQSYAVEQGRDVWAIARAGIATSRINDLLSMFPNSKAMFVHRNPLDIVRDALRDRPDSNVRDICDAWNEGMRDFLVYSSDRLLKLQYEDASENTDAFLSTIQDFTNAHGMSPAVVNVSSESEKDSDYEMGEDLKFLVQTQCNDMLAVYYPALVV